MLSKKHRLPIQKFIKSHSTNGARSDYFFVKFKTNNLPFSRFGVVISRKVSKSAVKRNRIKRIIFDFIRLKEYYLKAGKDVLIIVSPQAGKLMKAEIEKELEDMLIKCKM